MENPYVRNNRKLELPRMSRGLGETLVADRLGPVKVHPKGAWIVALCVYCRRAFGEKSVALSKEQYVAKLRQVVASGRPLVGAGAGTGISAKCAEAGGADFIIIYNHEDPPASVLKLIESARVPPGLRPGMNKEHKREACPRPQGAD